MEDNVKYTRFQLSQLLQTVLPQHEEEPITKPTYADTVKHRTKFVKKSSSTERSISYIGRNKTSVKEKDRSYRNRRSRSKSVNRSSRSQKFRRMSKSRSRDRSRARRSRSSSRNRRRNGSSNSMNKNKPGRSSSAVSRSSSSSSDSMRRSSSSSSSSSTKTSSSASHHNNTDSSRLRSVSTKQESPLKVVSVPGKSELNPEKGANSSGTEFLGAIHDLKELRAIKVKIVRLNIPAPPSGSSPDILRDVDDSFLISVHRMGEGERPIFDRQDIVVNQIHEERAVHHQSYIRSRSRSKSHHLTQRKVSLEPSPPRSKIKDRTPVPSGSKYENVESKHVDDSRRYEHRGRSDSRSPPRRKVSREPSSPRSKIKDRTPIPSGSNYGNVESKHVDYSRRYEHRGRSDSRSPPRRKVSRESSPPRSKIKDRTLVPSGSNYGNVESKHVDDSRRYEHRGRSDSRSPPRRKVSRESSPPRSKIKERTPVPSGSNYRNVESKHVDDSRRYEHRGRSDSRSPPRRRSSPHYAERNRDSRYRELHLRRERSRSPFPENSSERPGEYIPPTSSLRKYQQSHSLPSKSPNKSRSSESPVKSNKGNNERENHRRDSDIERRKRESYDSRDRKRSRSPYRSPDRRSRSAYRRDGYRHHSSDRDHSKSDHRSDRYGTSADQPLLGPQYKEGGLFIPNALLAAGVIPGVFPPPQPFMNCPGMRFPHPMFRPRFRPPGPRFYNIPCRPRPATTVTTLQAVTSTAANLSNSAEDVSSASSDIQESKVTEGK